MTVLLLVVGLAQIAAGRDSAAAATSVEAKLEAGGTWTVELHADLDALLLGVSPVTPMPDRLLRMESLRRSGRAGEKDAVDRLAELLRRRLRVRFDGVPAELVIEFPERRSAATGELVTLGSYVRLAGRAPAAARRFTFFASRSFRGVDLRVEADGQSSRQILEPGAESAPVSLP
jgi:hypothetical protein